MIRLTLPGSIRSKKNSKRLIMIGGKNVPRRPVALSSKAYLEWETKAREAAMDQVKGMFTGPIHVKAIAYCKGTLPDLSGMLESVGDCLEGILWDNDKNIISWDGSRVIHDKQHQRTEIEVEAL